MTEFAGNGLRFGDLILMEEFDHSGKVWRSFLLVPQEHLEDLFRTHTAISPREAFEKEPEFWQRISESTRDFYKNYLKTQTAAPNGGLRRQWFQWKDFDRLDAAFRTYKENANRPLRLSIVARDPVHSMV
jgi:hypothetical protein